MFPNADQIALAIVTACRITGDGPVATCLRQTSRARHIAFVALCEVFPEAKKASLARLTGYPKPPHYDQLVRAARKAAWWNDAHVDEVVGALAAETYGEQAA